MSNHEKRIVTITADTFTAAEKLIIEGSELIDFDDIEALRDTFARLTERLPEAEKVLNYDLDELYRETEEVYNFLTMIVNVLNAIEHPHKPEQVAKVRMTIYLKEKTMEFSSGVPQLTDLEKQIIIAIAEIETESQQSRLKKSPVYASHIAKIIKISGILATNQVIAHTIAGIQIKLTQLAVTSTNDQHSRQNYFIDSGTDHKSYSLNQDNVRIFRFKPVRRDVGSNSE